MSVQIPKRRITNMSWLYERLDQLGELRPFVEIAHTLLYGIPPDDRDDVEQEIILMLKRVTDKRGDVSRAYLWGVARNVVRIYWWKRYRDAGRLRHLMASNTKEDLVWRDGDNGARLDAIAILATLPPRLVEIGYKRLNGEELNDADESYWMKYKAKLDCRKRGDQLSEMERRRIVRLHNHGLPVIKIAKIMGRGRQTIDRCLVDAGLKEVLPYLDAQSKRRQVTVASASH